MHAGGEQLVDFGKERADQVTAEADELQADGQSNLVKTVLVAIDDFSDAERFPDPESPRRVVVFTGTSDSCGDGTDEICDEIEQTGIDAEFNLVGMKVSPEDRERLRNLQEQDCLGEQADVEFADTSEELNDAVADLPRPDDVPDCAPSC